MLLKAIYMMGAFTFFLVYFFKYASGKALPLQDSMISEMVKSA